MTVTPFFQKISILTSIQKHYTGNKHLFQSFYAFKIKNLSRTSHLSFFPLDYPQQKRKSPVKSLATIGGALHSLLGFLFSVSSTKRKKVIRPHHQNDYFSILPVIMPYLLLNWDLSFLRLDKVSYIYVLLCFPQTYPCCINHHSGLTVFGISNAV